ncbi:MAG: bifunctional aconitate hydratase 2 and 2-methylisocitrate dehydratase, partial [Actinomycetota bacterium]
MIDDYRKEAADRLKEDLPPLPLTAIQIAELITLLKSPH